jgi:hypothetical protein
MINYLIFHQYKTCGTGGTSATKKDARQKFDEKLQGNIPLLYY